jgi:hypothetical protein
MNLKIDGIGYSSYLPKRGYSVTYKPILGANSCYTLDGKYHEDILAYKAIITTELLPMKAEQLSDIINACQNCKEVEYFDTKTNGYVIKDAKATLSTATLVFNTSSKQFWNDSLQKGVVLTIEEV